MRAKPESDSRSSQLAEKSKSSPHPPLRGTFSRLREKGQTAPRQFPIPMSSNSDIAALGGHTMGTSWSVKLVVARSRDLHPLHAGIQAELDRVVAQMSTWEADSDISRYNRAAANSWHALPDDFWNVLSSALCVCGSNCSLFQPQRAATSARCAGSGTTCAPASAPKPHSATKGPMLGSKAPALRSAISRALLSTFQKSSGSACQLLAAARL